MFEIIRLNAQVSLSALNGLFNTGVEGLVILIKKKKKGVHTALLGSEE